MRFVHDLSPETQRLLRRCYKESQHHRVRQRAHGILLSFEGRTTTDLLHIFDVDRLTISHWFDAWETRHFAGLKMTRFPRIEPMRDRETIHIKNVQKISGRPALKTEKNTMRTLSDSMMLTLFIASAE